MSNIEEVTEGLMDLFRDLRAKKIESSEAVELNNTAGKIIGCYKVRIAYHLLRQEAPVIEGLEPAEIKAITDRKPRLAPRRPG